MARTTSGAARAFSPSTKKVARAWKRARVAKTIGVVVGFGTIVEGQGNFASAPGQTRHYGRKHRKPGKEHPRKRYARVAKHHNGRDGGRDDDPGYEQDSRQGSDDQRPGA